jgi:hypothetical protein
MRNTHTNKTTPRVKDGKVQKKNRWRQSPNYYLTDSGKLVIERHNPGRGHRHVLSRDDVESFIRLIPEWGELSRGLNAILLAPGEENTSGYYVPGVLHLCAWDEDLWLDLEPGFFEEHRDIFERLGVPSRLNPEEEAVTCFFEERTARAYQLLHIFLHELGHHHDYITSNKAGLRRGEEYAESYARRYEALIWQRYKEHFGFPGHRPAPRRVAAA